MNDVTCRERYLRYKYDKKIYRSLGKVNKFWRVQQKNKITQVSGSLREPQEHAYKSNLQL